MGEDTFLSSSSSVLVGEHVNSLPLQMAPKSKSLVDPHKRMYRITWQPQDLPAHNTTVPTTSQGLTEGKAASAKDLWVSKPGIRKGQEANISHCLLEQERSKTRDHLIP